MQVGGPPFGARWDQVEMNANFGHAYTRVDDVPTAPEKGRRLMNTGSGVGSAETWNQTQAPC